MKSEACPFCAISSDRVIARTPLCFAMLDGFPISPGHTLIIPRRHVGSWFDASDEERSQMLQLLDEQRAALDAERTANAYNIGINDGAAAGQTIPHLHMHLIPRFTGDVGDPRGGVRWVIPHKAAYWEKS